MIASSIFKSVLLFVVAGICEIGGGYLVWLWLRNGKGGCDRHRGRPDPLSVRGHSHVPACELWTSLCRVWGRIRCAVHTLGLENRQDRSRQVRSYWRHHLSDRRSYHHVPAQTHVIETGSRVPWSRVRWLGLLEAAEYPVFQNFYLIIQETGIELCVSKDVISHLRPEAGPAVRDDLLVFR